MATYRQRTLEVKSAIRQTRKSYRTLDSSLEKLERELDRLIKRKTLVGPESLNTLIKLWDIARRIFPNVEKSLADTLKVAAS